MEFINPKITIQNTDSERWLVTMEHHLDDERLQHLHITLLVDKQAAVADVQRALLGTAISRMQQMLGTLP